MNQYVKRSYVGSPDGNFRARVESPLSRQQDTMNAAGPPPVASAGHLKNFVRPRHVRIEPTPPIEKYTRAPSANGRSPPMHAGGYQTPFSPSPPRFAPGHRYYGPAPQPYATSHWSADGRSPPIYAGGYQSPFSPAPPRYAPGPHYYGPAPQNYKPAPPATFTESRRMMSPRKSPRTPSLSGLSCFSPSRFTPLPPSSPTAVESSGFSHRPFPLPPSPASPTVSQLPSFWPRTPNFFAPAPKLPPHLDVQNNDVEMFAVVTLKHVPVRPGAERRYQTVFGPDPQPFAYKKGTDVRSDLPAQHGPRDATGESVAHDDPRFTRVKVCFVNWQMRKYGNAIRPWGTRHDANELYRRRAEFLNFVGVEAPRIASGIVPAGLTALWTGSSCVVIGTHARR